MRSFAVSSVAMTFVALTGCYTLEPVRGTPPPLGTQVAFDVTDAGRVALGGSMGPEIGQVQGRLLQQGNGEYLLGVTSVSLLRGGVQTWGGEQVILKQEFVGPMYQRRLDKGKTGLAAVVGAGLAAFVVTQSISGSADKQEDLTHPDTAIAQRIPGPHRIPIVSFSTSRIPFLRRF